MISTDPLAPGTVYAASVSGDGTVGLYRVEVSPASGAGKLKLAGGVSGQIKESIQRAFGYLISNKGTLGVAREVDTSDFHVESIDLLGNRVEAEIGVALMRAFEPYAVVLLGRSALESAFNLVAAVKDRHKAGFTRPPYVWYYAPCVTQRA